MLVMDLIKLLPVGLLESQPVIFQTQQLRCIDLRFEIAPAIWKSHLRSGVRRCVLEIADAFWKRICGLNFAGAIFASQVRNWHRSCGAQPGLWHLLCDPNDWFNPAVHLAWVEDSICTFSLGWGFDMRRMSSETYTNTRTGTLTHRYMYRI